MMMLTRMSLSRLVFLVALFIGSCELFGVVCANADHTDTDAGSSTPNLSWAAKHFLGLSSRQHQHQQQQDDPQEDTLNRRLQSRACGAEIGRVSVTDLEALFTTFLGAILERAGAPQFLDFAAAQLTASLRYNIVAYKLCGSCADTEAWLLQRSGSEDVLQQDETVFGAYGSYCGSDKYGYSAQHSALVFLPVDIETGNTSDTRMDMDFDNTNIVEGSLRSLVAMHYTLFTVTNAPTEFWPTNLTQAVDEAGSVEETLLQFSDYIAPLVATSSGAVGVLPDYIGYGASLATHNRTFSLPQSYMQAAVSGWVAAKMFVEELTGGCTVLDSVVSVSGQSEGGSAAISAAPAFQLLGMRVRSINAGAASLDLGLQFEFAVGMYTHFNRDRHLTASCLSCCRSYCRLFVFVTCAALFIVRVV